MKWFNGFSIKNYKNDIDYQYYNRLISYLAACPPPPPPQMEKVEEDLLRSKALRENQTKEFSLQLDALREKYEEQVCCVCVSEWVCVCVCVWSILWFRLAMN